MARKGERDPGRERFWRAVLKRREQSGLSVKAFCHQQRLSEASFYYWRRELTRRDLERRSSARRERAFRSALPGRSRKPRAASQPLFRELAILGGPSSVDGGLEIVLPDSCRVHVSSGVDRQLLADVLATLEARRC
jgi:hypothetical protein